MIHEQTKENLEIMLRALEKLYSHNRIIRCELTTPNTKLTQPYNITITLHKDITLVEVGLIEVDIRTFCSQQNYELIDIQISPRDEQIYIIIENWQIEE